MITVDNITVVGTITNYLLPHLNRLENRLNADYIERHRILPAGPYDQRWVFKDGTMLEITRGHSGERPAFRIEFNPNKCDWVHLPPLLMCLEWGHFTRVDIALDIFDQDLSQVQWKVDTARSRKLHLDKSLKVETTYIGSGASEHSWRIYNKQVERRKAGVWVDRQWWRIEAQMRFAGSDKDLARLIWLEPFKGLVGATAYKYDHLDIKERVMLKGLHADPTEWPNLSPNSRTKYRNLEKSCIDQESCIKPDDEWAKEKANVLQYIDQIQMMFKPPVVSGIPQVAI